MCVVLCVEDISKSVEHFKAMRAILQLTSIVIGDDDDDEYI